MLADKTLVELTIEEALAALRNKSMSCVDYADALIAQCDGQAHLNALTDYNWDQLRQSAIRIDQNGTAGRHLGGIPLALKANINTTSLRTCAATGALHDHIATTNAPIADALFAAGGLLGAKCNMHELAFGITTNNKVTGATGNPYNASMIPGGSSGGVAAAIAARMMPGGIGTDTGASVRLPAALCGVVGYRPTMGRYSGKGIVPISHTRDTAGPITRTVTDACILDNAMRRREYAPGAGQTCSLAGVRIGLPRKMFYENLDPDVASEASRVLDLLSNAGVIFIGEDLIDVETLNAAVSFPVALYEFMQDLPKYLVENEVPLTISDVFEQIGSEDVKAVFGSQMGPDAMPSAVYQEAMSIHRPKLRQTYANYFTDNRVDAVLFPTSPLVTRPIGQDETVDLNGTQVPTFATFIRNTDPASNAGIPGISIPTGLSSSGLPIGMELDSAEGNDDHLLMIARLIEELVDCRAAPNF